MVNIGDGLFQIVSLIFLAGIFAVAYILIRSLISKQKSKPTDIVEQKLDRIINLLEKDKKE
ncbi:DUF4083 family protein [Peribacillus psychrosaccharolyticus]|uniref:DUF4083 family protein n=1 Tax=Peribacillus psychrosaccharolyticus TaxID=1407 RepID=A0A974NMT1_PERPY|nr:DUF4083 family protein [Peribacillus psychrosaccharolyticus]MEC2055956.1 DUF4083 family protein [Peribacillus psychrosaccharolyticus]MED3743130.1 DUF4083 family protein [Peribacillus psychrosaccharolyticus]QQT00831.1 DUF4083 family protein [Peribacillus psychrosaccharolyticus]